MEEKYIGNNIQVGNAGLGNSITINQHQVSPFTQTYTILEYDESKGTEEYTNRQIKSRAIAGLAIGLAGLGILADTLGVATYLGLTRLETVPMALICLVLATLDTKQIKLWFLPKSETQDRYVRFMWWDNPPGKFVHKGEEGGYLLYEKSAPCIFPKCKGTVKVIPSPPREKHNHAYIGICSKGGMRHTYAVDSNGIGYPQNFDWRPLAEE